MFFVQHTVNSYRNLARHVDGAFSSGMHACMHAWRESGG